MKRMGMYVVVLGALVLGVTGCAGKHAKWVCTNTEDNHVHKHCDWANGTNDTAEAEATPVVAQAKVEAPVVEAPKVIETPKVVEAPKVVETPKVVEVSKPVEVKVVVPEPAAKVEAPAAVAAPMVMADAPKANLNFGDYKSSTLTTKAWQALGQNDLNSVLGYTNKCISMYAGEAAKQQGTLTEYPSGSNDKIFSYWALNDVATSLFIQGEALRKAKRYDEAKAIFNRISNEFSYAQTYSVESKNFWKPADAAKDSLYMIDHDLDLDFGNMTSNYLVVQMWKSFENKKAEEVVAYESKLEHIYGQEAKDMQKTLKDYPALPASNINAYWALNDVATGKYILGETYRKAKRYDEAKAAFNSILTDYSYGQTLDIKSGNFWKPADGAKDSLYMIENNLDLDYGNMTSNYFVLKMWAALADKNLAAVIGYSNKLEQIYRQQALDMQKSLKDYPAMPASNVNSYWALNDVGTGAFILGEAYRASGNNAEAVKAYQKASDDYLFAQCWDPQGWYWKPAEAAQQKILEIQSAK